MKYLFFILALFAVSAASAQTDVGEITLTYNIDKAAVDSFFLVETIETPSNLSGGRRYTQEIPIFFSDTTALDALIDQLAQDSVNLLSKITQLQTQLRILNVRCEGIRAVRTAAFMLAPAVINADFGDTLKPMHRFCTRIKRNKAKLKSKNIKNFSSW